jgi:glutamine amidotransferase
MCRVVGYLGSPVPLNALLYDSDSGLVRQAYQATQSAVLNLAGFGLAAWNGDTSTDDTPLLYKVTDLPMYDRNLKSLARKYRGRCVVAHIRGANYFDPGAAEIGRANIHPFGYPGYRLTLAHNGGLARFNEMKFDLLRHIRPEIAARIEGTTDSEWIYALLLSQLDGPDDDLDPSELTELVYRTLRILRQVRERNGIGIASGTNLFVSDGRTLVATRFTFDFGCYEGRISPSGLTYHSLWYTVGRDYGLHDGEWKMLGPVDEADSILIASEPLTLEISTWIEVPEYTLLTARVADGRVRVEARDVDV